MRAGLLAALLAAAAPATGRGPSPFDQAFGFVPARSRRLVPPALAGLSLALVFLCASWIKRH